MRQYAVHISSTEVPQYLHEAGFSKDGMIGITQTRRVAASTLATRISQEQGTTLGELVGYSVRFEDVSGPSTKIKFLTDGMLVRDLLSDPLLESYSVIIIDEAHERTLLTDLLISRLREIQKSRNDQLNAMNGSTPRQRKQPLKIVIMSATLDAEKFSAFYNG
jgi:ATP-dependent RNA helicase DHX33